MSKLWIFEDLFKLWIFSTLGWWESSEKEKVLVQAAITNYCRLGSLNNNYFSQFWVLSSVRSGPSMVTFWWVSSSWFIDGHHLASCLHGGEQSEEARALVSLLKRALTLFLISSHRSHPQYHHIYIRISIYELKGGDGHIQTMTQREKECLTSSTGLIHHPSPR